MSIWHNNKFSGTEKPWIVILILSMYTLPYFISIPINYFVIDCEEFLMTSTCNPIHVYRQTASRKHVTNTTRSSSNYLGGRPAWRHFWGFATKDRGEEPAQHECSKGLAVPHMASCKMILLNAKRPEICRHFIVQKVQSNSKSFVIKKCFSSLHFGYFRFGFCSCTRVSKVRLVS